MNQQNLRSYGLSLILLALAVGSLGRTLHVADAIKMTLSAVSLLFSLVAIVMFVKATPANRRPITLGFMGAAILVVVVTTFLFLRR